MATVCANTLASTTATCQVKPVGVTSERELTRQHVFNLVAAVRVDQDVPS
jgi:hypothetical protein